MPPYWLTPCLPSFGSPHVSALLLTHPTWLPSLLAHPLSVPCRYVIGPTIHGRVSDR